MTVVDFWVDEARRLQNIDEAVSSALGGAQVLIRELDLKREALSKELDAKRSSSPPLRTAQSSRLVCASFGNVCPLSADAPA